MIVLEEIAPRYWHLLLGALVLILLWRLGSGVLFGRWIAARLPIAVAVADLILFPVVLLLVGGLLSVGLNRLGWDDLIGPFQTATLVAGYLIGAWLLARLVELVLVRRAETDLPERVPKLVLGLIYGTLMLVGLALFFWQRGYSFAGIWLSTGVAAAVLGLALQRTLGDLFSGIALGIERPFKMGDWVELRDGTVGQVIDLNWRATRLRGWDNATHVIPNSKMAGESLKNLHDDQHLYAPWFFVRIPAEVDPRFATALILDAARPERRGRAPDHPARAQEPGCGGLPHPG